MDRLGLEVNNKRQVESGLPGFHESRGDDVEVEEKANGALETLYC